MGAIKDKNSKPAYRPYETSTPLRQFRPLKSNFSSPISVDSPASLSMTSVSSVGTSMSPTRLIGLRKKERQLDLQIRKMEKRKDLIVKALKYKRGKESDKIEQLIQKWRTASQMASSYLLNSFQLKISAMGGISEWRKSIKRRDKEKNRYQLEERLEWLEKLLNSDQFSDLSSIEQQEIQDQIQDLTAANEEDEWETNDDEDYEFNMEEMLKYLKLDYNLLYGS